ncbi:MAG: hypothetical protein OXL41_07235 [Nitrospinae bacterium]|nr:hypothetical protein [Nitrospinota bacterium]
MKNFWFMGLAVCLLLVSACQRKPIERALRGSLPPVEENVVVKAYCQSCHLHASFEEAPHVEKQRLRYDEKSPLRAATRCLACHVVRPETFFKVEQRSTRFPHGVLIDIAKIPKPKPVSSLKREKGESPAPKQEAPPEVKKKEPAKKKKKRWYFLYLF